MNENGITLQQVASIIDEALAPLKQQIADLTAYYKGEAVQEQPTAADAYLQWQEKTKGKDLNGNPESRQQEPTPPQTGNDTAAAYFEEKARQQGKPLAGLRTEEKTV